ncbi:phosphate acyltransferase [Listeria costaricensis]|uniref:phosphate acyltransferase n=1 Tax=Listeria costaricensis TaxID=2026604 RepID=UPI000C08BC7F|nr:phosphate acyltransferase [Listeria costaricensis]
MGSVKFFDKRQTNQTHIFAVAGGSDGAVTEMVKQAIEKKLGRFLLFGGEKSTNIKMKNGQVTGIPVATAYTEAEQEWVTVIPVENAEDAAEQAALAVKTGQADILVKGFVPTSSLLHQVLKKEMGLRDSRLLSHLAVFEFPAYHKPLIVTDCAMNIAPDFDAKCAITENAIEAARKMGIEQPKIAFLSAVEKTSAKMPSTIDAAKLVEYFREKEPTLLTLGPVAMDAAISKEAAQHKGIESAVAGDPDILVVPNIETGNVLYKTLVYFAQAKVGSMVVGSKVPIVISSRSDSADNKLTSLMLTARMVRK